MTDKPYLLDPSSDEYERRMTAARARAEYELGDASWAGTIVGAFLYPDADSFNLEREKAL